MSKHTPGPWDYDGGIRITAKKAPGQRGPEQMAVASVSVAWRGSDAARADAYLIRSAPEMLKVLKSVVAQLAAYKAKLTEHGCESWIDVDRLMADAEAAIAQAEPK